MDSNTKLNRVQESMDRFDGDVRFMEALKERPGAFNEALSNLNELSNADAQRMLGCAVMNDDPDSDSRTANGWTALHLAVLRQHLEVVRVLILSLADVEAPVAGGCTPLYLACAQAFREKRSNDVALELLQTGANVHLPTEDGETPVTAAIKRKNVPLVKAMVELPGAKPPALVGAQYVDMVRGVEGAEMEEMFELLVDSGWGARFSGDDHSAASVAGENAAEIATAAAAGEGEYSLHRAITTRDSNALTALLASGGDPDILDSSGCTPLHVAARAGDAAMVEALVSAGSTIVLKTPKGLTPLHLAAMEGHVQVAEILLAASSSSSPSSSSSSSAIDGEDVAADAGPASCLPLPAADARDNRGRCPLDFAARYGKTDVIAAFVEARAALDCRDNAGHSPLYAATLEGEAGAVKALLRGGASADTRDKDGFTPLHKAVMKQRGDVIEALLEGGVSPGAGGEKGETPLHAACRQNAAAVSTLLRAGALPGHCWNAMLQSPLLVACQTGNADAVRQLLPRLSTRQINLRDIVGVNGQQRDGGKTALLTAILRAHAEIVDMLLAAGADPSIREAATNVSPLDLVAHCASAAENVTVRPHFKAPFARDATLGPRLVRALVEGGAEVDEVDPQGYTALQTACTVGSYGNVVQALLDAGADARAPCAGREFLPSLHLAAYGGNPGALRVLTGRPEYGDLNELGPAPDRCTPLGYAVYYGRPDAVRFLLEEGAEMGTVPFTDDNTPMAPTLIHLAASCGHGDVIRLLLEARQLKEKSELAV